jgi:antitoxin ParD1/3/4
MNVSLTPELERYIKQKLSSDLYQTASEVVREALRLLRERDERLAELRHVVEIGVAAAERGELVDLNEALVERIKANGRKRLAAGKPRTSA